MFHRLYCHIVWTTRDREPLIDAGLAKFLSRFLRTIARQERSHILEIGIVATHVHLLVRIDQVTSLPRLLQRLKGGSSYVAGKEKHSNSGYSLKWAKGYSIETVNPRQLAAVREYLRTQSRRHPGEAIQGWDGDAPEFEIVGREDWRAPSVH